MSILYFIVQYPHCLIAGSMNVNIIFYSPISNKILTFIDTAIVRLSDCCLTQQFYSYIGPDVAPRGHIIPIPRQPVFALSP
jgi:hypothetical protein